MRLQALYLALCLAAVAFVSQTHAVNFAMDVSVPVSVADLQCMLKNGTTRFITRAWRSKGVPDDNAIQNIKNAREAGFKLIDVYMFPCPGCVASIAEQALDTIKFLRDGNVKYDTLWLDIEEPKYWSQLVEDNQYAYEQMVEAVLGVGVKVGIYSQHKQWVEIFGEEYVYEPALRFPLWFARYDNIWNVTTNYLPFGGYKVPYMKQFSDKGTACSLSYDVSSWE